MRFHATNLRWFWKINVRGNEKINLYNARDFSTIGIVLVIGKFELRVFNGNRSDTNYLSWVKKCRKKSVPSCFRLIYFQLRQRTLYGLWIISRKIHFSREQIFRDGIAKSRRYDVTVTSWRRVNRRWRRFRRSRPFNRTDDRCHAHLQNKFMRYYINFLVILVFFFNFYFSSVFNNLLLVLQLVSER